MSKRNDALEALSRPMAPAPTATVVELKAEAPAEVKALPPVQTRQVRAPAAKASKNVAADYKRTMLYLPPKAKKKFKEIAFHSDRKEHDIYVEALREYLEKNGHKGLL